MTTPWLVELEPQQAALLEKVCAGPTISAEEMRVAGATQIAVADRKKGKAPKAAGALLDQM